MKILNWIRIAKISNFVQHYRQPTENSCFGIGDMALQPARHACPPFNVSPVRGGLTRVGCGYPHLRGGCGNLHSFGGRVELTAGRVRVVLGAGEGQA